MRYRDKKCKDDSWHDDKKCFDKKDDCKRKKKEDTVVEFDVSQSTPSTGIAPFTGITGTPENPNLRILDQVKVKVNDEDNEVLIQGTVEWDPNDVSLVAGLLLAILVIILGGATGPLAVPLSVQATFRVWRSEDGKHNGPSVPIFETTDTASLGALGLLPPALIFGPTTTSFHFVDKNPECGTNRYFSTIELSVLGGGDITPVGGILGDILDLLFPGGIIGFTTDTHVLTAIEFAHVDLD
ncbi:hypothetical protein HPB58_12260 [Priestia filamentosa]|uniref:hypothetical protein n=1 Tax=Priestia filamentosa TaxID=1402861 RepID=UPI001FB247EE|nr:hypothetical protein [Priestia filamentosa]UOE62893.1 hypothetical protein HPB58_12260 [Priestia filamentosa]